MDKVNADVERVIEKFKKLHTIGVLSVEYQSLEGETKQQCFDEIKRMLIEIYGIVGLKSV